MQEARDRFDDADLADLLTEKARAIEAFERFGDKGPGLDLWRTRDEALPENFYYFYGKFAY